MKKLFTVLLFLIVSAALFAGGGAQSSSAAGGLTEITHIVWDRGSIPAEQGTLMDNWWTKYVDEKVAPLGAKIRYITIPRAQEAQLLSTMLAANNAPDISKTNEIPLLKTYLTGGGIADITPYIEQHGANIKALLGTDVMEDIKYTGKFYWLPHMQNGIETRTTWIRKDWLDAIGMAVPETAEELYQVLKAIKEKDPGKRGSALIPLALSGTLGNFENICVTGFGQQPYTTEKLLTPWQMWPETREAYRFLNRLRNEGLLTDVFITDKDDSLFRQNIARGEIFAFVAFGHYPYHSSYGGLYDKLRETNPNAVLASIDPFKSSKGMPRNEYWQARPTYGYRFFVPASSKNVELTVKVLDFLSSEAGYLVAGMGIPNTDYTMVNNVRTPIDMEQYLARIPWVEAQYGAMAKPYPRAADKALFLENYIKDFNPDYYPQIRREVNYLSDIKSFPPTISAPTPATDKLTPVVRSFWAETIIQVVFGPMANFDRAYDGALSEFKALGGDEIDAELQRLYAEQKR